MPFRNARRRPPCLTPSSLLPFHSNQPRARCHRRPAHCVLMGPIIWKCSLVEGWHGAECSPPFLRAAEASVTHCFMHVLVEECMAPMPLS
ncbi:hypothetical protein K469DRAFT_2091 [Zopfia rhizophila CBS 207.26]|uniref:Uncharacterized protein n=1 Tax=Zopfia rhizophila CBS 207.26 TaxID=1314779 RepID=A0A6A6EVG2_9PEZI|nr:hypothetical protein K469DRAFT_2091 [Zopfia rhizophila CBS 207.26]